MKETSLTDLSNGMRCQVIAGTHAHKSGVITDIKTSKTGYITITVVQDNGERFKTLAKNVEVISPDLDQTGKK